jgi:hypothetical protein
MRLLFCNACRTLEPVPEYTGGLDVDPLVEHLVMEHTQKDPMAHGGIQLSTSPFRLAKDIPENRWAIPEERAKIIELVNKENKRVGFDAWVSEAIDTYADDALKCFRQHHRPPEACIDWWSDTKRIGRPTPEGKKAVKENYKLGSSDPHLCQFCPVASWVQTQINWEAGLYKEQ